MMETKEPIEKLRDYAAECSPEYEQYDSYMMRLADEIEAAYMKLPVDADGVPIRPGDTVGYFTDGQRMYVQSVCENGIYYRFTKREVDDPLPTGDLCHVKHETIFDILEELVLRDDLGMLSVEAERDEMDELLTRYAERIRKAVE